MYKKTNMTTYHIQTDSGFRECTFSEWNAAKNEGCETYSLHHIEGTALIAIDPAGSFLLRG